MEGSDAARRGDKLIGTDRLAASKLLKDRLGRSIGGVAAELGAGRDAGTEQIGGKVEVEPHQPRAAVARHRREEIALEAGLAGGINDDARSCFE